MSNTKKIKARNRKKIVLNLGCNQRPIPSTRQAKVINVDIEDYGMPDKITKWNLEDTPWPWKDNMFDRIIAYDLIEHLREWREGENGIEYPCITLMNEAHRVLRKGGVFEIMVPSDEGRGASQDPTHVSRWNENSFYYFAAIPSKPEEPDSPLISHPWRSLYPHLIKAAFTLRVGTGQQDESGIVYVLAELTKVHLPADEA